MADPLLRNLTLLQLIPRDPGRIATTTLQEKLAERGYVIDMRSLQRDLKGKLSQAFPICCDDSERPYRWYYDRDASTNLPAQDPASALALVMAQEHLKDLMPPAVSHAIAPIFNQAHQALHAASSNRLINWSSRVRAISGGKKLKQAQVQGEVWYRLSNALLNRQVVEAVYLSRNKESVKTFKLHPQGIVNRQHVTYLLAMNGDYEDVRQYALHRIQSAECLEEPCRESPNFDIDDYIAQGGFDYRNSSDTLKLKARVRHDLAWMLSETPLAESQVLTSDPEEGWYQLEAEVPDDGQTFWWLLAQSARVDVLEPRHWREEIFKAAQEIVQRGR
jgi:predicted DNA-binding transcriptional regulator YafY